MVDGDSIDVVVSAENDGGRVYDLLVQLCLRFETMSDAGLNKSVYVLREQNVGSIQARTTSSFSAKLGFTQLPVVSYKGKNIKAQYSVVAKIPGMFKSIKAAAPVEIFNESGDNPDPHQEP